MPAHEAILKVIRRIPPGFVATYGDVAERAGLPGRARLVGTILRGSHGVLPWHRVVGAGGVLSVGKHAPHAALTQRMRLEKEGVRFRGAKVDLSLHRWGPASARGKPSARRAPRA